MDVGRRYRELVLRLRRLQSEFLSEDCRGSPELEAQLAGEPAGTAEQLHTPAELRP